MNDLSTALRSVLDGAQAKSSVVIEDDTPSPRDLRRRIDIALRAALLTRRGAFGRWRRRRARGLDDVAMSEAISREIVSGARAETPETPAYETRGGSAPELWLGGRDGRRPDLKGDELVAAARRVMGVAPASRS
jgi:hypothetical protein